MDPDEYLVEILAEVQDEVLQVVMRMAARKKQPPMTTMELVDILAKAGVSNFAIRLRDLLNVGQSVDETATATPVE